MSLETTSLDPAVINSCLITDASKTPPRSVPVEHIGSPSTPTTSRRSSRASGLFTSPTKSPNSRPVPTAVKRASFGIIAQSASASRQSRNFSDARASARLSHHLRFAQPVTSESSFLTALAAQERRVLELKEELEKAENDLQKLKQQWAMQEAAKRRSEVRLMHQMQLLQSADARRDSIKDDLDGSSARMYEQIEERKALMSYARTPQRKVFSGSRQIRALSLLTPAKGSYGPSWTEPAGELNVQQLANRRKTADLPDMNASDRRNLLAHSVAQQQEYTTIRPWTLQNPERDLVQAGKQVATDLQKGLWTFFEDLKHAAVGNETGTDTKPLSHESSRASSKSRGVKRKAGPRQKHEASKAVDIKAAQGDSVVGFQGSFWRDGSLDEARDPEEATALKSTEPVQLQQSHVPGIYDSWETWGTPDARLSPNRTSSTTSVSQDRMSLSPGMSSSVTSTNSAQEATPRPSFAAVSTSSNQDAIPWPELQKLAIGQLRRTASHLIRDWEKTLTPAKELSESEANSVAPGMTGDARTPPRLDASLLSL